jgi:hypothetical protein
MFMTNTMLRAAATRATSSAVSGECVRKKPVTYNTCAFSINRFGSGSVTCDRLNRFAAAKCATNELINA